MKERALLLFAALAAACEPPPPPLAAVAFHVADDSGGPIPGAAVSVDGRVIAATDARGEARCDLPVREAPAYRISHACPAGYREVEKEERLRVRALEPLSGRGEGAAVLVVRRHCAPKQRRHVLLVRAFGRGGLPVRVLGRLAATTDPDGVAMVAVDGAPGDEIEVVIDTSGAPRLRPASPSRRIALPDARRFFIFDQRFEERSRQRGREGRFRKGPSRL